MAVNDKQRPALSKWRAKQRVSDFRKGVETAKVTVLPMIRQRYFIRGMAAGVVLCAVLFSVALYCAYNAGTLILTL